MKQLLSIEWLKLRHYRTFYIIAGLFVLLCNLLIAYQRDFFVGGAQMLLSDTRSFEAIWQNSAFYTSHVVIFLSLLLALLTTNEFQYRTHRQNIIDGWKRMDFYHAKWGLALCFTLLAMAACSVAALLYALVQGSNFGNITDGIEKLLWLLLLTINYMGFGLTLALLLRRAGLTIIIMLVYYMMAEPILHTLLRYKFEWPVADLFLPLEVSDQLLPLPRLNIPPGAEKDFVKPALPAYVYAMGTLVWIGLYYFLGRRRLEKSDW